MKIKDILNFIPFPKLESRHDREQDIQRTFKDAYEIGRKSGYQLGEQQGLIYGYEEGQKDGMNFIISHSRDLTEAEFDELIKFLKDRNMIIAYHTDKKYGGVAVRVDITKDTRPYTKEPITGITFLLP